MANKRTTLEGMLRDVRDSFRQQRRQLDEREDDVIQGVIDSQIDSGILRNELN